MPHALLHHSRESKSLCRAPETSAICRKKTHNSTGAQRHNVVPLMLCVLYGPWYFHIWAHSLGKGNEHPRLLYSPTGVGSLYLFTYLYDIVWPRICSCCDSKLILKGSVKGPNMFHNYETEKITHKASETTENLQLYRLVRFFHQRSLCTTTHLVLFSECPPICIVLCMTISGGRTKQNVILLGFGELAAVN